MKLPSATLTTLEDIQIEYERFFEFSLDMLCISSYDGHFKRVNHAFEKALGFSAEELCTKSYLDFIHPEDIEKTTQEVERQMLTKQSVFSFENRYRCRDGSYKLLCWNSAPVGNFMYAVARDVTESKRAHEELQRTKEALEIVNRELEAFSYSVAHDLRTPLRGIMGFSSLVLEDSETTLGAESKTYIEKVISASKRMAVLIESLLNFSRLARKDLAKHPVSLSEIAHEVIKDLQASNPNRQVEFKVAAGVAVEGDPVLLKAVMENLLSNAWKYTSKVSRNVVIEFGILDKNSQKVFFVRDNGAGFDMRYANKLFGVFHRLHTDREFEGTGIGLATVQRIIQRHGGQVWAEGIVDQRATFYFTLP